MRAPSWITAEGETGWINCSRCGQGFNVTQVRSSEDRRVGLIRAFIILHSVHDSKGFPKGLTPTGRTSKAAAAEIATWQEESR